jgi:hypothetical protein
MAVLRILSKPVIHDLNTLQKNTFAQLGAMKSDPIDCIKFTIRYPELLYKKA